VVRNLDTAFAEFGVTPGGFEPPSDQGREVIGGGEPHS
jgi:hypothetical protein